MTAKLAAAKSFDEAMKYTLPAEMTFGGVSCNSRFVVSTMAKTAGSARTTIVLRSFLITIKKLEMEEAAK